MGSSSTQRRRLWRVAVLFLICGAFFNPSTKAQNGASNIAINYGMVADNLPPPAQVVNILRSISVTKTRIYSANTTVLSAFANSGISIIIGIGNEDLVSLTDHAYATDWVQTNVAYYQPATAIAGILVGNEVFSSNDTALMGNLLLAMQNLNSALTTFNLDSQIFVSTAHSLAILSSSYPPSAGIFVSAIASSYLMPLLEFLRKAGAPFMINAYPYFAYKASPDTVSLQYALSASPSMTTTAAVASAVTVTDPNTGLVYTNMLDAQVDAIYAALAALGYTDMEVTVSETGWPSAGDPDEAGASVENAQTYNGNLIERLERGQGTPSRPNVPLQAFIFALFNEDLKPGPLSERNYGLFKPDGTPAYNFGIINSANPYAVYTSISSSPHPMTSSLFNLLISPLILILYHVV